MKPTHFQLNHIAIFLALTVFSLWGCKKEKPLTPNEEAGKMQTENFTGGSDFGGGNNGGGNNGGGNNGGGNNGGGNNGGGNSGNAYFKATIDGVNKSFSKQTYTENQLGVIVQGTNNGGQNAISFTLMSTITEGDTISFSANGMNGANYIKSPSNIYSANKGAIVFDKVNSTHVEGAFYFTAISTNGSDSVKIKNGSFYINR